MKVTVFDHGAGNLHSLVKALELGGALVRVETEPALTVRDTDALILPGVGAFAPAAKRMAPGRDAMRAAIAAGLPCLGICLGMQLLFDRSEEGPGAGLGVIPGDVCRLATDRVPHIGWNPITPNGPPDTLLVRSGMAIGYYANSFVCRPSGLPGTVVAWSQHENDRFPAVVRLGAVVGTQFHPEKSSREGIRFLKAFLEDAAGVVAP